MKLEYKDGKLILNAKRGVVSCMATSVTFSSYLDMCSATFVIDMKDDKFVLSNMLGCKDKNLGANKFFDEKSGRFYVGGAPEYVRKKFK